MKRVLTGSLAFAMLVVLRNSAADDLSSARTLMDPAVLREAQFGMSVLGVEREGAVLSVTTTGAGFRIDPALSQVVCHQRLGRSRKCATVSFPADWLADMRIVSETSGAVVLDSAKARLRLNGDSLLMVQSKQAGYLSVETHFRPGYDSALGDNRLILDNYGGIGVFLFGGSLGKQVERPTGPDQPYYQSPIGIAESTPAGERGRVRLALASDQVAWVSVCPPRPFNWQASLEDSYFTYWTDDPAAAYPSDEGLKNHIVELQLCNVYILQNEMTLWKEWQLAFEPRHGIEEFRRVLNTVHRFGARLMVYTSPSYFVRGTPNEAFTARYPTVKLGPAWGTGENLDLFLPEIRKVLNEYGADGLYFDGLYAESLAQSYRLVREARKLLGDKRLLCIHDTWLPPGNNQQVYCPTINAYGDVQLRGEDIRTLATHDSYLRYVMSGHNISNNIGHPVPNGVPAEQFTEAFIDTVLEVNGRFFFGWGMTRETLHGLYRPKLNDSLRSRVEEAMAVGP